MNIFIGIILGLLALASLIFGGVQLWASEDEYEFPNIQDREKYAKEGKIATIIGIVLLITFIVIPFSIRTVDAGEIAVVKYLGKAKEVRTSGTYFDFWLVNKYDKYDAKVQNLEVTSMAYSKDAQTMDIVMTVQYKIDDSKAIQIANQYGSMQTLENRIQSITIEKTKAVLSQYSAMQIIENRANISPEVEKSIKNAVDGEYCVDITTVVLTNIDFSDAFEQTVEDKMIAEQEKLKAQYEKETAIINAEKELEVAKLAAEAKIEAAKADAKSLMEIAKAEASSIRTKSIETARALGFNIVENTIVDEETGETSVEYTIDFKGKNAAEIAVITDYLRYVEYLDKWDGKLPTVTTNGAANVVVPSI